MGYNIFGIFADKSGPGDKIKIAVAIRQIAGAFACSLKIE